MEDSFELLKGDCLSEMYCIEDGSVDMVLADLPYQLTNCKWDSIIPLNELWPHYERVLKPAGVIALTASQPFTSLLVMSKPEWFRHEWIWIKNRGSNFANTVREPMKEHEAVLIFCRKTPWTYNRQMQERTGGGLSRAQYDVKHDLPSCTDSENYCQFEGRPAHKIPTLRVPSSWQKHNVEVGLHPTQKPVPLMECMIRTYTEPNEVVLDNTMGSGTTGVAALSAMRKFIGIEKDEHHFATAKERIERHYSAGVPRPCGNYAPDTLNPVTEDQDICTGCFDQRSAQPADKKRRVRRRRTP